jgi:thiol-disulfide isomerase/thioredoxin
MTEYHLLGANWCGPCNQVKQSEVYQQAPVQYHDVDTDEGKKLANEAGANSIPTLVVMEDQEITSIEQGTGPVKRKLKESLDD